MHEPQHDLLSAYIDHACTPQETKRLTVHLQGCSICREALDTLRALRKDLLELPSPTLGFDLAARLQDQLRPVSTPKNRSTGWWRIGHPAGLAIAASLVSGLWLGTLLDGTAPPDTLPMDIAMVRVFDPIPPGGLCTASMPCPQTEDIKP